jgi:hypothetical protein
MFNFFEDAVEINRTYPEAKTFTTGLVQNSHVKSLIPDACKLVMESLDNVHLQKCECAECKASKCYPSYDHQIVTYTHLLQSGAIRIGGGLITDWKVGTMLIHIEPYIDDRFCCNIVYRIDIRYDEDKQWGVSIWSEGSDYNVIGVYKLSLHRWIYEEKKSGGQTEWVPFYQPKDTIPENIVQEMEHLKELLNRVAECLAVLPTKFYVHNLAIWLMKNSSNPINFLTKSNIGLKFEHYYLR